MGERCSLHAYLQWRIDTGIKEATASIIEGGWDNGVTIQRLGAKLDIVASLATAQWTAYVRVPDDRETLR